MTGSFLARFKGFRARWSSNPAKQDPTSLAWWTKCNVQDTMRPVLTQRAMPWTWRKSFWPSSMRHRRPKFLCPAMRSAPCRETHGRFQRHSWLQRRASSGALKVKARPTSYSQCYARLTTACLWLLINQKSRVLSTRDRALDKELSNNIALVWHQTNGLMGIVNWSALLIRAITLA